MGNTESLQLFEDRRIRTAWNEEEEKWYFSIVDIISVLTDSVDYQTARKYWNKLKQRLSEEGNESVTNCHQLKLTATDGKQRITDEWKKRGLKEGPQFATLTDIIYKAWSDMSAKEYKKFKGLTKEISESREPDTFEGHMQVAADGGSIARNARLELEALTGRQVKNR